MKKCNKCGIEKPAKDFYKDARGKGGLKSQCKVCHNAQNAKRRSERTPEERAHWKEYHRNWNLKKHFGMTVEDKMVMLENQNHQCSICGTGIDMSCDVDHCHTNGHVRGLLCRHCNTALGLLQDDPKILRKAAQYLDRNRKEKN